MYEQMKVVYENGKSFYMEICALDKDEFYMQLLTTFEDAKAHYNPDDYGQFGIKHVEVQYAPQEYDEWFLLPKPKEAIVQYGSPQIEKTENGYKAKKPVEIIDSAIRAWGDELGEHIMKRICEVWNDKPKKQ